MSDFPRTLQPVEGPFARAKILGAAEGMGEYGSSTRDLVEQGYLQPDLITGMTLALLARQPRRPSGDGEKKASGVAGGVWVRERFTIHRPIKHDDAWVVEGEQTGTHVKKGRSYSTTTSRSHTADGERFATNLTTGLTSYRPDPDRPDSVEGLPAEDTEAPGPDWEAASDNPHTAELQTVEVGQTFGGAPVFVSLAMMAARDTDNPDNPIHSDPEQAKKAGLDRPIAGGSHVLAFALEPVMAQLGPQVLLHGAHLDVRWKAPTKSDVEIVPTATVTAVEDDRVEIDLLVELVDGPTAMVGSLTIPIA